VDHEKIDNDRVQSFHMQSQRRILGVKWHDKITNTAIKKTTRLTDLSSLIADRRHSLFGHIYRLSINDINDKHCIYPLTPSPAHLLPLTGSASAGPSTENLASTNGMRYGSTHQCLSILNPGPLVVEIATTLSRTSLAVSE